MIVTHKIKMDLSRRGITPVVHMVQGDSNTRALEISLYDNGQPWAIPQGVTAAVAFSKADGTKGLYDKLPDKSNATTIAGSVVTAILAPEVLTCAGQVRVAIVLYDAEMDTLATFTIMVVVEANPAAGKQISNNYYYLQNMEQVNAAAKDLDRRVKALEEGGGSGGNSGGNVDQGNTIFNGKTASFYGDSLTEANYHYTKGYHSWVKDLLGLASYNNYGVSGYKVSDVYYKVNSVTDAADIIFVMCGVNDQNYSVPLGAMGDNTTGTTYGALNLLCALLKEKYPTKLVVFITPHYQTKYPHSNGITSYEVSKAIREVCEKYAIPVYDNFVLSGIYSTNLSTFTTDNCHWNNTAHEMVGKNLAKFVADSFRYVYGGTSDEGGDSGNEGEEDTTVSVTGISLDISSGTLTEGERVTLTATVLPNNATNKNVTWKSSNNSVATVSGGVVSAVSEGTAVITATTKDGGYTATYTLTVEDDETENTEGFTVNATIKSAEINGVTHIGFMVEGPVGTAAIMRLECDIDDGSKIGGIMSHPFVYATIDKLETGAYGAFGGAATKNVNGNHYSISGAAYNSTYPYWVAFVPIKASSVPVNVVLSNVVVYIDDISKPILAVGTFKNNSTGTYADITVSESAF